MDCTINQARKIILAVADLLEAVAALDSPPDDLISLMENVIDDLTTRLVDRQTSSLPF